MDEVNFVLNFISNYVSTYLAIHNDDWCMRGEQKKAIEIDNLLEEAKFLAENALERIVKKANKN